MGYIFNGISLQNCRQSNMDSLLLKRRIICGEDALIVVVCDGVGSLADGAFASAVATKRLGIWFDTVASLSRIGLRMRDAILEINGQIVLESRSRGLNTATTLSALLLVRGNFYGVSIGDSRIYYYKNNILSLLTSDDVSESGKLTACIGRTDDPLLQYYEGDIDGKTFLVCSDGLYKRIDDAFMTAAISAWVRKASKHAMTVLSKHVMERGERDNISFALAKTRD